MNNSFEENLSALKKTIKTLEDKNTTLDSYLENLELAYKLSKICNKQLNDVDKEMYKLFELEKNHE